MNRLSFFALSCGAMLLLVSGCGGGSGLTVPTAQSSAVVFVSDRDYINQVNPNYSHNEIYRMNADGSNQTRITNSPEAKSSPHLSRDGKTIVFSGMSSQVGTQIFKVNADGTSLVQLTSNASRNTSPTISPDGRTIAWSEGYNSGIFLMDINGNNQRLLTQTNLPDHAPAPSFSPDGTSLVYDDFRSNQSVLVVRTLSNGNERVIQPTIPAGGSPGINTPHFSPDGKRIVFSASSGSGTNNSAFLVNIDGSDAKTPTTVFIPSNQRATPVFNPSNGALFYDAFFPESKSPFRILVQIASAGANSSGGEKIVTTLGDNFDPSFAG